MTTTTSTTPAATVTADVALDLIAPDPANPARPVDAAFAASIAQHGVLQPILVRPTDDGRFTIIAGERRWRAAVAAGQRTIAAVVRTTEADSDAGVWQAVENLERQDLPASFEARAVARIMAEGMKQRALAAALNRPVSWVRARLALAGLPVEVQEAIDTGRFQPSDALTFAKYLDRPEVITAALESRFGNDLDWTLQQANRRYDEALAIVAAVEALTERGITAYRAELPANVTARLVSDLAGIDTDAHAAEPCHIAVVRPHRYGTGDVETVAHCTEPQRHATSGDSELTVTKPITKRSPERQAELDRQKADRTAKAHRDAFARDAIMGRIRSKDLAEIVLPVLLAVAGQTELVDAAKVLGVTEPESSAFGSSHNDWAGPFARWATESPANLHRAMLAVAYAHGTARYSRPTAADTVTAWLDSLGYEPATE